MVQTHDLGTLIHSRWIFSYLRVSQTKATNRKPNQNEDSEKRSQGYTSKKVVESR